MIYIGYITDQNNDKIPLTYGSEEDMLSWKSLNLVQNDTTDLFLLPDDADPDLCLSDIEYFRSFL